MLTGMIPESCPPCPGIRNKDPAPKPAVNMNLIGDFSVFHFLSRRKASPDEIMFLLIARQFGLEEAIHLGAGFRWKFQRPLLALLATLNESGKGYPKRGAKARRV